MDPFPGILLWPGSGPLIRAHPLAQGIWVFSAFRWAPQDRTHASPRVPAEQTAIAVPGGQCQMPANGWWWDFRGEVMLLQGGMYTPSPHSISTLGSTLSCSLRQGLRDPLFPKHLSLVSLPKRYWRFPSLVFTWAGHQPGPPPSSHLP